MWYDEILKLQNLVDDDLNNMTYDEVTETLKLCDDKIIVLDTYSPYVFIPMTDRGVIREKIGKLRGKLNILLNSPKFNEEKYKGLIENYEWIINEYNDFDEFDKDFMNELADEFQKLNYKDSDTFANECRNIADKI